jgi:hypothetical protein
MRSRRKESPEAPFFGLFGGRDAKSARGMKKESASSKVRWMKAREVRKLKRAWSPLLLEQSGRAGGRCWSRERKPLKRRYQAVRFGREA